mgnify:CR=1 FL=1
MSDIEDEIARVLRAVMARARTAEAEVERLRGRVCCDPPLDPEVTGVRGGGSDAMHSSICPRHVADMVAHRLRAERDALLEHAEAMARAIESELSGVNSGAGFPLIDTLQAYRADPRLAALRGEP